MMKNIVVALLLLVGATASAQTKPFRADGGIQSAAQSSWTGSTLVPGWYYKNGSGWTLRNPDNSEYGPINLSPMTLYKNATPVSSVTSGEIDAQSFTMAANTLTVDGQKVVCDLGATHAANTNSATYKFYVAGTAVAGQARATSNEVDTNQWICVRSTSTTLRCTGLISNAATFSTSTSLLTGINFASSIIIKTAVLGATTNGDMVANYLRCELWP